MPNILICDDERDILGALKIYLSDPDYTLFEACNGQQAVEIVEREDIHLVLLDVMMPVLDGISAMARIRERSNIPIILLTAKSEDNDKILGLNCGADDYITKPFNPLEVTARVRSQLRRYLRLGGGAAMPECHTVGPIDSPRRRSTARSGTRRPTAATTPWPSTSATCGRRSSWIRRSRAISRSSSDRATFSNKGDSYEILLQNRGKNPRLYSLHPVCRDCSGGLRRRVHDAQRGLLYPLGAGDL